MSNKQIRTAALGLVVLLALSAGCVSRYRMDFYMVDGENRKKIEIEATEYTIDTRLNDPLAAPRLMPGSTSTVTISVGTRGDREGAKDLVIAFDEYLKYRIYVELPSPLSAGPVNLIGHSFVQLLKRYELPPEESAYLPVSGNFVIDSVKDSDMFATLQNGVWKNSIDSTVAFEGRLKIKIR